MKTNRFSETLIGVICLALLVPVSVEAQFPDSTVNYYTATEYYDAYYDSLIQVRGVDSMKGTGYTDYLRFKWFYNGRHGVDGNLGDVWQSFSNYYDNYEEPEGYTDESNWSFIGPFGIPLGYGGTPEFNTGKGMMLSIWVNENDHSMIYAGSHHGGLWKTLDGGENWYPLNDNDQNIHGVNSLAVDPNDYNIIYITGRSDIGSIIVKYYTAGVFKSTDGGNTFEPLDFPGINYPSSHYPYSARKIMIPPEADDHLFYVTLSKVFRSNNGGDDWIQVFSRDYQPWDGTQNGFYDFKICPWQGSTAYLAGHQIFEISDPLNSFDATEISGEVFLAGMDPNHVVSFRIERSEITMNENYSNKVWFCYVADYTFDNAEPVKAMLRVVECNRSSYPYSYTVLFEDDGNDMGGAIAGNKLEFAVSTFDEDIFYIGGVRLFKLDLNQSQSYYRISDRDAKYPEECWLHDDIRDMQVMDGTDGNDILYLADDSGISWGTEFEEQDEGCNNEAWHWRHPCSSIENGLNITEFYGTGLSDKQPYLIGGGCQDLGSMRYDGNGWINFGGGDGSELLFDPSDPDIFYYSEMQTGSLCRTNDGGISGDQFFVINPTLPIIPIALDPIFPSILYSGNKRLLKFTGINDFSITEFVPEEMFENFENRISCIKVIKKDADTRRYFVATDKSYSTWSPPPPDPSTFEGCLFYADEGDESMTDISQNLTCCSYGFISDVEVNPYNPNQIWVCAVWHSVGCQNSKVYTLTLPGNEWMDYSQGLPEGLPVYKIKFIPPMQQLFALTDVGVYTRNLSDPQWYPYDNKMPKKIVIDMDVNLRYHKIVAATYGRGLWETEIEDICHASEPAIQITGHDIWSTDHLLHGDIEVKYGGILEMTNCNVFMPENATIIVEQGGKLIIDNTVVTSACPLMWSGIEVWGTNGESQFNSPYFGILEIRNGSVIENARTAIANYPKRSGIREDRGGIIKAMESSFRNNQVSIDLDQFRNFHPQYPNNEVPYFANFYSCRFEHTYQFYSEEIFKYFVQMAFVYGIEFKGCDFINHTPLTGDQGEIDHKYSSGIYSIGSQFYVDHYCTNPIISPCEEFKPSTFSGLNYGIYAMGIDLVYTVTVDHSDLTDNITGIYLRGVQNATIIRNSFEIIERDPSESDIYGGLYLDYCSGYTVEENFFTKGSSGGGAEYVFGLVVKDSGEEPNEIYNNVFTSVDVGIEGLNHNRNEERDRGLLIKCNEFNIGTKNNIIVARTDETVNPAGIAKFQGSNENVTTPAGNLFWINPMIQIMHYNNALHDYPIIYTMHNPATNERVEPVNYTELTITLDPTNHWFIKDLACPSHLTYPSPGPGVLKTEMTEMELKIDSTQTEIDVWIDGGNTEQVIEDISLSTPPEAYDVYSDLMLKSPYLSDTVMKESIGKEEVLNNVMIEDILVANPQSAKSVIISKALENKAYPLSDEQLENIDLGRFIASEKEKLEAKLAWRIHSKSMIKDDIITIYMNDTVNSWARDSLYAFLSLQNTLLSNYQLAFLKIAEGDSASAVEILENIEGSFDLNALQSEIHQQYEDYMQILESITSSGNYYKSLDSTAIQTLYTLSAQNSYPGIYALNLLQFLDTLVYIEPYVIPEDEFKSDMISAKPVRNNDLILETFKIYPNPAMSYFVVENLNTTEYQNIFVLQICNVSGKCLETIPLPKDIKHKIISTKKLNPGIYLCKFVNNNKEIQTIKLSVIK